VALLWRLQGRDEARSGEQALIAMPPLATLCSRKDTGKTARTLALKAQQGGEQALFDCSQEEVSGRMQPVPLPPGP
jgi:hypothetical protein